MDKTSIVSNYESYLLYKIILKGLRALKQCMKVCSGTECNLYLNMVNFSVILDSQYTTGGPSYQSVQGVQLHVEILSKCMGNLNFLYNVTKNNKIGRLPPVSRVVVILCVYGEFWSGLDKN